ncbi:hypothetical protein B4N89_41010 [Embleya scabrispora]|uniref:Uncharacterized protein n=1 Tax=Embleya scabrispora TaxID=159449 RepID=A0A1T3NJG3_9ACTN|nr:hypothetical protein B4N89_41010 [Embleya scabrispora]
MASDALGRAHERRSVFAPRQRNTTPRAEDRVPTSTLEVTSSSVHGFSRRYGLAGARLVPVADGESHRGTAGGQDGQVVGGDDGPGAGRSGDDTVSVATGASRVAALSPLAGCRRPQSCRHTTTEHRCFHPTGRVRSRGPVPGCRRPRRGGPPPPGHPNPTELAPT